MKSVSVYKLRHKPTGLYFKASGITGSNLSKDGNIYTRKPSLRFIDSVLRIGNTLLEKCNKECFTILSTHYKYTCFVGKKEEFEIVEFKLTEVKNVRSV